tara:strand:- start:16519 stop:17958 length:1440 start_codon:yes stop_codon:yes gene_type:complete
MSSANLSTNGTFRVPYQNELTEINPLNLRSASGAYIHHALFRNWLWINENNELIADLAEKCEWKSRRKLRCQLKSGLKWSDGSSMEAKDFLASYEFLLDPKSDFTRKETLFSVRGARKFAQGDLKTFSKVGIKFHPPSAIEFELESPDPEFEYKLALPMTAPVKQKNFNISLPIISSGPYRIKQYDSKNLEIKMESNPNYHIHSHRPDLSFVYISDDSIQIPLFSKNQIDLVRRVPTAQIPQWRKDKSFLGVEVLRFDYFGFNFAKIDKPTRLAMSEVIDYKELQKLLNSTGRPGCFDFSTTALDKPICFEIKKSKRKLMSAPKSPIDLSYSHLGGEDHQRTAEWLKSEWKKYLDIEVTTKQIENKAYISLLKAELPAIFRKGIPLETPLCYSAVKIFEKENPENIFQFSDAFLEDNIAKLKIEKNKSKQKVLCNSILEYIKSNALIIPTGKYELSILLREPYRKLKFNKLNMADFSQY